MLATLAASFRSTLRIFVEATSAMLAADAASFRRLLSILCEIAGIVRSATATVTVLAALAPGFRSTLTILVEAPAAVLPADLARSRSLLSILGEVARIACMSFGHWFLHHAVCRKR